MYSLGDLLLADLHKQVIDSWEDETGFLYRKLLPPIKVAEIEEMYVASRKIETWLAQDLTGYTLTNPTDLDWLDCICVKLQEDEGYWYVYVFKNGLFIDKGWINRDEVEMVEYEPDQQTT